MRCLIGYSMFIQKKHTFFWFVRERKYTLIKEPSSIYRAFILTMNTYMLVVYLEVNLHFFAFIVKIKARYVKD